MYCSSIVRPKAPVTAGLLVGTWLLFNSAGALSEGSAHPLGDDPCDKITDPAARERCQLGLPPQKQPSGNTEVPEIDLAGGGIALALVTGLIAYRRERSKRLK